MVRSAVDAILEPAFNGSLSLLHDSGVNFTAAAARQKRDEKNARFWYLKLGYSKKLWGPGMTFVGLDYSNNKHVDQRGDEAGSYGLFAVHKFDHFGTEVYLGLRNHKLDRSGARLHDIFAALFGTRVKF